MKIKQYWLNPNWKYDILEDLFAIENCKEHNILKGSFISKVVSKEATTIKFYTT